MNRFSMLHFTPVSSASLTCHRKMWLKSVTDSERLWWPGAQHTANPKKRSANCEGPRVVYAVCVSTFLFLRGGAWRCESPEAVATQAVKDGCPVCSCSPCLHNSWGLGLSHFVPFLFFAFFFVVSEPDHNKI